MNTNSILSRFASFLVDSGKLEDLVNENIRLSKVYNLQVLTFINDDDQIKELTRESLANFLKDASEGKALEGAVDMLDRWGKNEFAIPINVVSKFDLVSAYTIRKQLLLKYLDDFTSDPTEYLDLVKELDNLISNINQYALQVHFKST